VEFIDLNNKDSARLIKDVLMFPLKVNKDESGVLVETLKTSWEDIYGPGREFTMQYYSITPPGLARDESEWHFHPTVQEDRMGVIQGEVVIAVADKREGSETKDVINLFRIKAQDGPYLLLIPKKTYHAFLVSSSEPAI
jgi:dTDP-4-dehydrorhamnose 3,5-epimerase